MFVVRHETDAYIHQHGIPGSTLREYDILEGLQSLSMAPTRTDALSAVSGSGLTIKTAGREISLDSTLVIKTRVAHKPLSMDEVAPQLWVSQTPKLVRAYHTSGVFEPPTVEDATNLVSSWEKRHQETMSALGVLMKKIVNAARSNGQVTIRYQPAEDTLIATRGNDLKMLPDDLYHRWEIVPSTRGSHSVSVMMDDNNGNVSRIVETFMFDVDVFSIHLSISKLRSDTSNINPDMQKIENLRQDYDNGEYLSQGIVNHKNRSCVVSLETLVQAGLYELYPEFNKPEGRKTWTNRVRDLRLMCAGSNSTSQQEIRQAFQIARSCFINFQSFDLALILLAFKNRRGFREHRGTGNPRFREPEDVQRYLDANEMINLDESDGASHCRVSSESFGPTILEEFFDCTLGSHSPLQP